MNQISKTLIWNSNDERTLVFLSFISPFFSDAFFFLFLSTSWLNSWSCRDVCLEFNAKIMKNSSGMHGPLLLKASKEIKWWEEVKPWISSWSFYFQALIIFFIFFVHIQMQNISCLFKTYLSLGGKYFHNFHLFIWIGVSHCTEVLVLALQSNIF